jgi:hypothetical protein
MEPTQVKKVELEIQDSPLNKFLKISMIVLFLVAIGLGGFLYINSMQKNKVSNNQLNKSSIILITPTPTLEPDPNIIDVGSVETDLQEIGKDVKNLQ